MIINDSKQISTPKRRSRLDLFLSDSDDSVEIIEPMKKKVKALDPGGSIEPDVTLSRQSPETTNITSSSINVASESSLHQGDNYVSPSLHDDEFAELDAWLQSGCVEIM